MGKMSTLLLLVALAACQAPKGGFCSVAEPLRLSADRIDQLSPAEVKALLSHNRKGMRLCGWKP